MMMSFVYSFAMDWEFDSFPGWDLKTRADSDSVKLMKIDSDFEKFADLLGLVGK